MQQNNQIFMHEGEAKGAELIIYEDGTLYHIDLKKSDNIPQNLFFVGSAGRVDTIAEYFDEITFEHQNKTRQEFKIKAGTYKGVPVGVFSCGMGAGNIEIVMTEFHALFEYDHKTDTWAKEKPNINIIRVGTSGTSHNDIKLGTAAISEYTIGLDNLSSYYTNDKQTKEAQEIEKKFLNTKLGQLNPTSYAVAPSPIAVAALKEAAEKLEEGEYTTTSGITTSSPGFFGPEGRSIGRVKSRISFDDFLKSIQEFEYNGKKIINHEMETSGLFKIGVEHLGYNIGAICLVLDNLANDDILEAKEAKQRMDRVINIALEAMLKLAKT